MKVLFDARYTRTDYHDGISRYSAELGNALLKLIPVTFLISSEGQKRWFPADASFIKIHSPTSALEPFTARILNKYSPDVVYSPMQTIGTAGRNYKSVLTLHDMIYYRHPSAPKFLPAPVRAGWWLYHQSYTPQRLVLKGADLLTTVSETSASDIMAAHMSDLPAHVIYNAPQKFSKFPVKHAEKVKNVVFMGSFMKYKNVETLIKGMAFLPGRTLHLLSRISPKRKAELSSLIPADATVVFHDGVTDEEYEKILANNAVLDRAISRVASSKLDGLVVNSQLESIDASKIAGSILNSQLESIFASKVTGSLVNSQLESIDISKVIGSLSASQIRITSPESEYITDNKGYQLGESNLAMALKVMDAKIGQIDVAYVKAATGSIVGEDTPDHVHDATTMIQAIEGKVGYNAGMIYPISPDHADYPGLPIPKIVNLYSDISCGSLISTVGSHSKKPLDIFYAEKKCGIALQSRIIDGHLIDKVYFKQDDSSCNSLFSDISNGMSGISAVSACQYYLLNDYIAASSVMSG
ncbi:hypothetical protein B7Z28_00170 [Candidatus Saccharibacteria bacterium 32-45-3]|nr:MAG: hypothetical protein B7Z28_00170 [Candidatus Saccharibacteria bacterium 32-45-3]